MFKRGDRDDQEPKASGFDTSDAATFDDHKEEEVQVDGDPNLVEPPEEFQAVAEEQDIREEDQALAGDGGMGQPLAQPSHPTATLNISTTWPSQNALTTTHECSDADIRHKVCDQVQHKHVAAEWIASHRLESEASNAQEREQIPRNGEVDPLAKMATRLSMPDYDPQHPEDIAICGGPTPTPARKWILQRRRVATFDGAHWVSRLPMRGD